MTDKKVTISRPQGRRRKYENPLTKTFVTEAVVLAQLEQLVLDKGVASVNQAINDAVKEYVKNMNLPPMTIDRAKQILERGDL